jgi:hypothetical protein
MKAADRGRWWDKNERLNAVAELCVGNRVTDAYGVTGVVREIDRWERDGPLDVSNHGSVTIDLDNGEEAHYMFFGWQRIFRRT